MAKRANGEGNVYQRANGTWEARFSYLDPDTGQRRRVSFYGPTAKAARDKMKAARERLDAGAPVKDATRSVGDWLAHWRATTLAASDRKETTRVMYAERCRHHLEPAPFGAIPLDRLKPSDVEALLLALRGKGLADNSIRQIYTALRLGLDGAVRDGLLVRNPAAMVRRPGVRHTEARYLTPTDVTAVLQAAEASRYHAALVLIAATGLRRGEALALAWDRVDLDAGLLRITATLSRVSRRLVISEPKTARSRRTIPLSSAVVAMLRRHRAEQLAERLRAGNQCATVGWCSPPSWEDRSNQAACRKCSPGQPGRSALRVSACTRCGTPPRWRGSRPACISRRWLICSGTIAITGDIYGHTSDDTARAAVDGLASQLGM